MFIAQFKDGSSFAENQGYWDDCPDNGITALHLTLPFRVMKKNPDGSNTQLSPSTLKISGFDDYYFANQRISTMPLQGGDIIDQEDGAVIAGIDYKRNSVCYFHVDPRGNVTFHAYPLDVFLEEYHVSASALRHGDKYWEPEIGEQVNGV